jgi:hypothetical protein
MKRKHLPLILVIFLALGISSCCCTEPVLVTRVTHVRYVAPPPCCNDYAYGYNSGIYLNAGVGTNSYATGYNQNYGQRKYSYGHRKTPGKYYKR